MLNLGGRKPKSRDSFTTHQPPLQKMIRRAIKSAAGVNMFAGYQR